MKQKKKGLDAERELIHKFWAGGWAATRVAGSGSNKYPSPDIIAGNVLRRIALECKATKETKKYLTKEEVQSLKTYSEIFGAEPWIAIRFDRKQWYFISLEDLEETEKHYSTDLITCKRRGLSFNELIGKI